MWEGWSYPRRARRRTYLCCSGCAASWIWADRVNDKRWKCDKCNTAWPQGDWATGMTNTPRRQPRTRRDRTVLVERPPGLTKPKQAISAVETTLKKAWGTMPKEAQDALKGMGVDFTPAPLEEVLKAHLDSLPSEVKDAVVGLIKPTPAVAVDVTGQLKATVGELRQLATKKQSLQRKVDQAKEQYKVLLDELKLVQEAIDKEHKQLGDQSEAYAKQLKEEAVEVPAAGEHVLGSDATEHALKALGQDGIVFNATQQQELERNLAETLAKRRKTDETQLCG